MSSTSSSFSYPTTASNAVDGLRFSDFSLKSCTLTTGQDDPTWWQVDLEDVYTIQSVQITSRAGRFEFMDV